MDGADKALLMLGGVALLDRVLNAARPVADRLMVAGPPRSTAVAGVEFRPDTVADGGPVPPILAAAEELDGTGVLLVVAVDMPLVTTDDLYLLLTAVAGGQAKVAAAIDDRGEPNPLLAAYRVAYLRSAATSSDLGPGSAATLLLGGADHAELAPIFLAPRATVNVNTPADLEATELAVDGG